MVSMNNGGKFAVTGSIQAPLALWRCLSLVSFLTLAEPLGAPLTLRVGPALGSCAEFRIERVGELRDDAFEVGVNRGPVKRAHRVRLGLVLARQVEPLTGW